MDINKKEPIKILPSIVTLFVVSVITYYKIIFYETGYLIFGDLNFPFPDILVEKSLFIWNEAGMSYRGVWQLPLWILILILKEIFRDHYVKIGIILSHFVPMLIGSLVIRSIVNNYYKKIDSVLIDNFIIVISGLLYLGAPIVVNIAGLKFLTTLGADIMIVFPLFIYIIVSKEIGLKRLIAVSLIASVFLQSPRELIYHILASSSIFIPILLVYGKSRFISSLRNFSIFLLLLVTLSAYSFVPYLSSIYHFKPFYLQTSAITAEQLKRVSTNQQLSNAFRGLMKWWSVVDYSTDNHYLYFLWYVSSWLIPLLAFSSLISGDKNRKRIAITFGFQSLVLLFLVKGVNPPFESIYEWLVLKAKLPFSTNWIFREPSKFFHFLAFPYALLVTLSALHMIEKGRSLPPMSKMLRKTLRNSLMVGLISIILLYSWPLYTGNFKNTLHLTQPPQDYIDVNKIIQQSTTGDKSYGNMLWWPPYGSSFVWSNAPFNPDPILMFSPLPFYNMKGGQSIMFHDIMRFLENREYESLINYTKNLGISYVAVRFDVIGKEREVNLMNEFIVWAMKNNLADRVYAGHYIELYKMNIKTEIIQLFNSCIFNPSNIFVDTLKTQSLVSSRSDSQLNPARICSIFLNTQKLDLIYQFERDNIIIPSIIQSNGWKTVSISGFYNVLKTIKIKPVVEWDFGVGIKYAQQKVAIPKDISFEDGKKPLFQWDFIRHNECSQWINLSVTNVQKSFCTQGRFKVMLFNSTRGWKAIKSPLIPVNPDRVYRFVIKIRATNAHQVHIKIFEFDSDRKLIRAKYIEGVGDGTFDWREVTFNYIPQNREVRYTQLQIWHGDQTNKPLPNIIEIDYVRFYDITKYAKKVSLDMSFEIDRGRTGDYLIFIRIFENQKGGSIKVYLDGKLISEINTANRLDRFVWKKLGVYNISPGRHDLTIENVEGFNAVNLFILIPKDTYYTFVDELDNLLKNKVIIHSFEAESDLFVDNIRTVYSNIGTGWGVLLDFGSSAWQYFEIIKEGYYVVALRLSGTIVLNIDNRSFNISSIKPTFVYTDPIYLSKGPHKIIVEPFVYKVVSWSFNNESITRLWRNFIPEKQFNSINRVIWDSAEDALRVELYNSTIGWKSINSPLIPIEHGFTYVFRFKIKARNGHNIHFKIIEYDKNYKIINSVYASGIGDGTFDWREITYEYIPKNKSTFYLQLQIWHGDQTNKPLPNIIWIDDVQVYKYTSAFLDEILIFSEPPFESLLTIENLSRDNDNGFYVIKYQRINPATWKLEVNATKPFLLVFAEAYDSLWRAIIYKDDRLIETINSIPVNGVINGFWIKETGTLTIVIRYLPQDLFELGIKLSLIAFTICIISLILIWMLEKRKVHTVAIK